MRWSKALSICSLAAVFVLVPEKATGSKTDEPPNPTQPSHFGTGGMIPLALYSNYASSGNKPPTVNLEHPPNIISFGLNDKINVPISETISAKEESPRVSGYVYGYSFKTDENGDLIKIPLSNGRDSWEGRKPRKHGRRNFIFDDKLPIRVPMWFNDRGRWPSREPVEDENIPIRDVFWNDGGFGSTGRQGDRHHRRNPTEEPTEWEPRPMRHRGERDRGIAPQEEPTWPEWRRRPMRDDDRTPREEKSWRDWGSKPKRHHEKKHWWDGRPEINLPYDNGITYDVIDFEPRLPRGPFEELNTQRGSTS